MLSRESIINRFSMNPRAITLGLIIGIIISFSIVLAEHEPSHRYTIMGKILDSNGNPLSNVEVTVINTVNGLSGAGVTDRNGKYSIQLHLHDENLGDGLVVTARGMSYEGEVTFNSKDLSTERIMVMNLRGETWTLGDSSKAGRTNFTSIVILIVLIALLYFGVKSPRKSSKKSTARQTKKREKKQRK